VVNEAQRLARKSAINFKTNSFLLYSFNYCENLTEVVSSILSSLVKKNFKKSVRLP